MDAFWAKKRMDKEDVFGNKISVNFIQKFDGKEGSPQRIQSRSYRVVCQPAVSSSSSRESSPSQKGSDAYENGNTGGEKKHCQKRFDFPPPPLLNCQNYMKGQPNHDRENEDIGCVEFNSEYSGSNITLENDYDSKDEDKHLEQNNGIWSRTSSCTSRSSERSKSRESSPFPLTEKGQDSSKRGRCLQKNIGRVSPFMMSEGCVKQISMPNAPQNEIQSITQRSANNLSESCSNSNAALHSVLSHSTWQGSQIFSQMPRSTDCPNYTSHWATSGGLTTESAHPVGRASPIISSGASSSPVELLVTNLDQNFEINEMKKILFSVFREHVMVLHISMLLQPDGSLKALIKIPSLQDAQYAISQLHRRKIGYKRILISYVSNDRTPPLHVLRSEVLALLNDIPSKRLPLFKFRELFEKRYHRTISVSELYKMREAIYVQEDATGRMVCLNMDYRNTPSPTDSEGSQEVQQILEKPYCERHFQVSGLQGWAEQDSVYPLPDVYISLKTLAPRVHTLLDTHQGSLPLNSFCSCYTAEFGPLPVVEINTTSEENLESRNVDSCEISERNCSFNNLEETGANIPIRGVPLEHLVACIPGVQITKSSLCIKKVQWLENKTLDIQGSRSISPALAGQLSLFSREMTDLLKGQQHCTIPFNKFIPTYHHHFGRQCRVADYGFTKLIDLLEAVPHVVQLLGQGQNRLLTLTHRTQVKRFAVDLLRILKSRASKQITLSEFPSAYKQCLEKPFDVTDYGVCEIGDILSEISENIVMATAGDDTIIAIPKREQTPEEIERTKQFSAEVVELLRHTPACSMSFNKFIPAYHHHFGKQCRVSDYGFSKLIELFEAIPDVLEVQGAGEDKMLKLTEREHHKILSERLISVIRSQPHHTIPLDQLSETYTQIHGHVLHPHDFGAVDIYDLLQSLRSSLKIVDGVVGPVVTLVDRGFVHQASLRIRRMLMEQLEGKMTVTELCQKYHRRFGHAINLIGFYQDLEDIVKIEDGVIKLTPLQMLARDVIILLHEHGGHMPLQNFEVAFLKRFGVPCRPAQYGFPSLVAMLQSLPDYIIMRGRRNKRMLLLNRETAGSPLPPLLSQTPNPEKNENGSIQIRKKKDIASTNQIRKVSSQISRLQSEDLLSQPIPSGVPSPDLEPEPRLLMDRDLMGFESPICTSQDFVNTCDIEQRQIKTPPLCEPPFSSNSETEDPDAILKAMVTYPKTKSDPCSLHSSSTTALSQCAVAPQYKTVSPYSSLQPQPVTYFFNPQTFRPLTSQMQSPTVESTGLVLHQSSVFPFHTVVASTGLGAIETQNSMIMASATASTVNGVQSPITGVKISAASNLQANLKAAVNINSSTSSNVVEANDKMRPDSLSYEDLSNIGNISMDSTEDAGFPSTQSTPTRTSARSRTRSRIAAHFSIPLEPQ